MVYNEDHFVIVLILSPQKIADWVNNKKVNPGVAFDNVKTHKEGNPLRLITSCCGTPIENLSAFTEFYLQPLAHLSLRTPLIYLIELKKINNDGPEVLC